MIDKARDAPLPSAVDVLVCLERHEVEVGRAVLSVVLPPTPKLPLIKHLADVLQDECTPVMQTKITLLFFC